MAFEVEGNTAVLDTVCGAEDAGELADWLAGREEAEIDFGLCTHIHAAVFQTLVAFPIKIVGPPVDPFLAQWIMPYLLPTMETHDEDHPDC